MKRTDIEVGQEYAVLSPSQRDKVDDRYGPNAKRVMVLDVEPVWVERYTGWRDDSPVVKVAIRTSDEGGVEYVDAKDRTQRAGDYSLADAKRAVKVLRREASSWNHEREVRYYVEVVPISQVAMTWAEYARRREVAELNRREADRIANIAQRQREAQLKALRERESNAGVSAASIDKYRGTVALTFDQYERLLAAAEAVETFATRGA